MKHHAFPAECPRCHAPVLATQWDFSDLMPTHGTRRADPVHITPDTETACIILGRPTYNLHTRAGRPHLTRRDPEWHRWHYHGPAEAVLPAHQCGRPLPGTPHPLEPDTPDSPTNDDTTPF